MDNAFVISSELFKMNLKPRAFMVYCCLMTYTNAIGECYPSRGTIARDCGIDRKTVDTAIQELTEKGLVAKSSRHRRSGGTSSNLYQVTIPPELARRFPSPIVPVECQKQNRQ